MKVTGPTAGKGVAGSARSRGRADGVASAATAPPAAATAEAGLGDIALLAGVPEAELTPKVRGALMTLLNEVRRLRGELEQSQKRIAFLETLSDQDALVPLINRRAFVRELSRYLSFAERYGTPGCVLYLDLDQMKRVNDAHGHAAGDALLKHVADLLLANLRSSDIVGRLGGDEFGVILINASRPDAERKAGLLARRIADTPLQWQGRQIQTSVSWGVYGFSGGDDVDETLRAADEAMYSNKRARA